MRGRLGQLRRRMRRSRGLPGVSVREVDLDQVAGGGEASGPTHPMGEGIIFRPRLAFRIPVVLALVFWLGVGITLLVTDILSGMVTPLPVYASTLLFVLFFLMVVFHYHHFAIQVDLTGVSVVGAASFKSFGWREIIRVEGDHSFFPGCRIYARSGDGFGFSGLVFEEHRTLVELIQLYSGARDED